MGKEKKIVEISFNHDYGQAFFNVRVVMTFKNGEKNVVGPFCTESEAMAALLQRLNRLNEINLLGLIYSVEIVINEMEKGGEP
jgi:hypothetical protein